MTSSLISQMRDTVPFMRGTAGTVLIAFTLLILQPLAAAAQTVAATSSTVPATATPEDKLAQNLQHIEAKLTRLDEKLARQQDHTAERDELKQRRQTLAQQDQSVRQDFHKVEQHIHDHGLAAVILERHQAMVAHYQEEYQALTDELDAIDSAADDSHRRQHAQSALNRLKARKNKRSQQPFDPKNLPFNSANPTVRPPKDSREQLEQLVKNDSPVQLAATSLNGDMLAQAAASPAPQSADLSPTEDAPITADILALADSLNRQPVAIFNWVKNNIDYLPTYGSIQGAQLTLENRRGNAFDTASLLIALLRASGIPARYVYGTVQIPIEPVMNWVGGVQTPQAALALLAQGGIPSIGLAEGGVIKYVKLEHIWVEAWVDYIPSRAAQHRQGDSWIAMDASLKQHQFNPGLPLADAIAIDSEALVSQALQTAQLNEQAGYVANIDEKSIETQLASYRERLVNYVQQTKPDATVGDVIGTQPVIEWTLPSLASGLPYRVISATPGVAALNSKLRHYLRFKLYGSAMDKTLDSPLLSYQISLPKLSGQRVSFSYQPASEADRAVIDQAFADYQKQFPAYLVHMTPTLKIEDQTVATQGSFAVGSEQILTVETVTPWYAQPRDYAVASGDFWVLGVNAAGLTPQAFQNRLNARNLSQGDRPDYTEEMFHQIMLGYWSELNAFEDILGATNPVAHYQLPSHGFAGAPVDIVYNFGIPRWASYRTRMLDVKENRQTVTAAKNEANKAKHYLLKAGMVASYLESGIYDQAFLMEPGYSMSAATALKKANQAGIPIYRITDVNLAQALPQLTVDTDVKTDVANAVNAGLEVLVSRDPISAGNFKGVGYISLDPVTGAGSYRISGGREGDNSPAPESVYPLVQIPATPILGLMMGSLLRSSGARLVASGNGMLMGISIPDDVSVPGPRSATGIIALITVVSYILSAFQAAIDEKYPKKEYPEIFRKYAESGITLLNYTSFSIRESLDSTHTHGKGVVYLARHEKDDLAVQSALGHIPIACPPYSDQKEALATIYELPNQFSPPLAEMAESYIEIKVTRDNLLEYKPEVNNKGATEIVVTKPLLTVPGKENRYLLFGPSVIGISFNNVCF